MDSGRHGPIWKLYPGIFPSMTVNLHEKCLACSTARVDPRFLGGHLLEKAQEGHRRRGLSRLWCAAASRRCLTSLQAQTSHPLQALQAPYSLGVVGYGQPLIIAGSRGTDVVVGGNSRIASFMTTGKCGYR